MTVDTEMATPAAHDYIPGTVHLVDLQGTIHARHAEGGKHDIVLVPAPSANPDDPLNWTPRRKLLSLFCLSMYASIYNIRCSCTRPVPSRHAVADICCTATSLPSVTLPPRFTRSWCPSRKRPTLALATLTQAQDTCFSLSGTCPPFFPADCIEKESREAGSGTRIYIPPKPLSCLQQLES
jgi:hypothetical protein